MRNSELQEVITLSLYLTTLKEKVEVEEKSANGVPYSWISVQVYKVEETPALQDVYTGADENTHTHTHTGTRHLGSSRREIRWLALISSNKDQQHCYQTKYWDILSLSAGKPSKFHWRKLSGERTGEIYICLKK